MGSQEPEPANGPERQFVNTALGSKMAVQGQYVHGNEFNYFNADVAPPVPRMTSPPGSPFENRIDHSQRFDHLLDERRSPLVVLVHGPAGVGKSALARWLAHNTSDRFPGGDLYVDLDSFRQPIAAGQVAPAVSIGSLLTHLLGGLGVMAAFLPNDQRAKETLYRTCTREKPVLVVLDNVDDPHQVEPFLPTAAGSAVLAVVRDRRFSRMRSLVLEHNAELFEVQPLSEPYRRDLLRAFVGAERMAAEPEAVDLLIDSCSESLTTLRLAGGQLKMSSGLRLGQLAAELADLPRTEGDGVPAVGAIESLIQGRLDEEAARACRLLSLIPGLDFSSALAGAVLDRPADTVAAILEKLVTAEILERDDDSYHYVSGLRKQALDLAQQIDTERDRDAVVRLAVTSYLGQAVHADLSLMSNRALGFDAADHLAVAAAPWGTGDAPAGAALAWFKREHANLLAMQLAAHRRGWHDLSAKLAAVATALHLNIRDYTEWIESSTVGISDAMRAGLPGVELLLRSHLSRAYQDRGETDNEDREIAAAEVAALAVGKKSALATVREVQGRCFQHRANNRIEQRSEDGSLLTVAQLLARAESALRESVSLNEQERAPRNIAVSKFALGKLMVQMGRWRDAETELNAALTIFRELPDQRMAARTVLALGEARQGSGDLDGAREMIEESLRWFEDQKAVHYYAEALEKLANVYQPMGLSDLYRKAIEGVLRIHERNKSPRTEEFTRRLNDLDQYPRYEP